MRAKKRASETTGLRRIETGDRWREKESVVGERRRDMRDTRKYLWQQFDGSG